MGSVKKEEKNPKTLARPAGHPDIEKFRQAARRNKVVLLMNTEELERGKAYNNTFFFSAKGDLIGRYRKHFLAPGEEKAFQPGRYMEPVKTPFGNVAVIVCWEIHFPDLCVRHLLEGADFFIWQTMPFGDMAMGVPNRVAARAADLAKPFVVVTYALPDERASTWDGITTMAADAFGRVTGAAPQKPGVYVFEIDTDQRIMMTPWGQPPEKASDRRAFIAGQRRDGPVLKSV